MTARSSESSLVADRYASALIDMAEDAGNTDKIEKDMQDLGAMIAASEDLQRLIRNPLISRDQQKEAILAIAGKAKLQELTSNFLGVLACNRRRPLLEDVVQAIGREMSRRRGEIAAHVQSAYALSPEQTASLQKQLSEAMGTNVTLQVDVNKDLLGGMVVTVGSTMVDDSVRSKLDKLRRTMNAGSNENQQVKEVG